MCTSPVIIMLSAYLLSFYEKLGGDLAYMSFFMAFARGLDVITDPAMSNVTDSFRR